MPELQKYRITFLPWQVDRPDHPAPSAAGWITVLAPDEAAARELIAARVGEDWHLFADDPFDDGWIEDYPLGELARWTATEAQAEVPVTEEQHAAVLAIHTPDEYSECAHCHGDTGRPYEWPCPTAQALGVRS